MRLATRTSSTNPPIGGILRVGQEQLFAQDSWRQGSGPSSAPFRRTSNDQRLSHSLLKGNRERQHLCNPFTLCRRLQGTFYLPLDLRGERFGGLALPLNRSFDTSLPEVGEVRLALSKIALALSDACTICASKEASSGERGSTTEFCEDSGLVIDREWARDSSGLIRNWQTTPGRSSIDTEVCV